MSGDLLATAEELLTQDIDANPDNYNSYANRAIVLARIAKWDHALQDADKVRCTDPS
jgi:tetratricopeptide (TPR) repeat protein